MQRPDEQSKGAVVETVAPREAEAAVGKPSADAVAQARAETTQEVAEVNITNVVEFIDKSLKMYLLVLGLVDVLPADFNKNLRLIVKEVCCAEDFTAIEASPNIQHPAIRRVLIRLVSNLLPNIQNSLSSGNLLMALQNIVLIAELSRVAGISIPASCNRAFSIISAFPIQAGIFGELVKRARTLLGVALNAEPATAGSAPATPAAPVVAEEKKELPLACDYRKITDDMIKIASVPYLIACSSEAFKANDLEYVIRFQREVTRREPKNKISHIQLAKALTNLGRYQEALDERRLIAALDPNDTENQKFLSDLEEEIGRKVPKIKRYEDFAGENLETLTAIDLNSYIIQTMKKRDWQNVLRFAEEYKRREPNTSFGYIYSAIALEKLGRIQQALEVREALGSLLSAGVVIELKAGQNAECIRQLKRALEINLLGDALKAEDAQDWEKSVEMRRQLIELYPSMPVNFYLLSFSLEFLGRFQEAMEAWEKFLALPNAIVKPARRYRLEELQHKAGQNRPAPIRQVVEAEVAEVLEPAAVQQQLSEEPLPPEAPSDQSETVESAPQPSNIDTSNFGGFLTSLQRAVEQWPVDARGVHWRQIPDIDKKNLEETITNFQEAFSKDFPKAQYLAFWKSFGHLYDQIFRGAINVNVIVRLIEIRPEHGE